MFSVSSAPFGLSPRQTRSGIHSHPGVLLLALLLLNPACRPEDPSRTTVGDVDSRSGAPVEPASGSIDAERTGDGEPPVEAGRDDRASGEGGQSDPSGQKVKRWSGISMANLKDPVPGLSPDQRCQISHVYRGSPGDRAGAREGDMITALNGQPILKFQDVGRALRGQAPGYTFDLTVWREGRTLSFPVTIEARPADMRSWQREAWTGTPWVPFEVTGLNFSRNAQVFGSRELAGKVVILDFWATWCGPCQAAMPELERLQREYGPKGLVVLGISSEEEAVIGKFLARRPLAYQVARDLTGEVKQDYEVSKLPTLYVIDQKGIVQEVAIGSGHVGSLQSIVKKLLG